MSETALDIKGHHVDMFSDLTVLRSQQLTDNLRKSVTIEDDIIGRAHYFDQVGKTETRDRTNLRYPPSPHQEVGHFRRKIVPMTKDWGHAIDRNDRLKMFTQLDGKYVQAAAGAFARDYCTEILRAAGADAIVENEEGTTSSVPLPSTSKIGIQVGSSGPADVNMNVEKARRAKSRILSNDVDVGIEQIWGIMPPDALYIGLMSQTEFTSQDFNVIKPLAGLGGFEILQWMGVNWILSNRCPGTENDRKCYMWAQSGVALGIWREVTVMGGKRPDLCFADYLYADTEFKAIRLEEEKVVEISIEQTVSATTNP